MRNAFLALMFVSAGLRVAAIEATAPITPFGLPDSTGNVFRLADCGCRPIVITFLGVDCPLARLYAGRLVELQARFSQATFIGIDSNAHDAVDSVRDFAQDMHLTFPILLDPSGRVAAILGASRTPEVFVLDRQHRLRYRGRIDDQYDVDVHRQDARASYVARALDELLAGREVSLPRTEAVGCRIDHRIAVKSSEATYCRDIAPLLQRHCQACHCPGQVGPFSLTTYDEAAAWAESIREMVIARRMPPWHADPRYGRFANDPHMSDSEIDLINRWISSGMPEGNRADLPSEPRTPDQSTMPRPDLVLSMPESFAVPAQGTVDYQTIEIDPGFKEDRWVRAAQLLPGNRRVVHHCTVFLAPPGSHEPVQAGSLGSYCLMAWAPGTDAMILPEGMAKLIPAGWKIVFVIHYTPIGSPQTDRTSIALAFIDQREVGHEVATQLLWEPELRIPPMAADYRVEKVWQAPADILLLSLFPHMHLRGRSFRYEAIFPNGQSEILLDVPHYNFAWQNTYRLAEARRLPAGTRVRCLAHYDNSAANPANPDPSATVRTGIQNTDEMFNGYFDWTPAKPASATAGRIKPGYSPWIWPGAGCAMMLGGYLLTMRRIRRRAS